MNVVNFFLLFLDFQDEEDLRGRPLGLNNRRRRQGLLRTVRQGKRSHVVMSHDVVMWRRYGEIFDASNVDSALNLNGMRLLSTSGLRFFSNPKILVAYEILIDIEINCNLFIFIIYSTN